MRTCVRSTTRLFARHGSPSLRAGIAALPSRTLKSLASSQPTTDVMTGEPMRLPDLDVSGRPSSSVDEQYSSHISLICHCDEQSSLVSIQKTDSPKPIPAASKLIFGHTFTDHMLTIPWSASSGWGSPEIKPCELVGRQEDRRYTDRLSAP